MTAIMTGSKRSRVAANPAPRIADEEAARRWFEQVHFPGGDLHCLRCGSGNVYRCKHKTMPFRCRSCKKYFSVKTGTAMEASNLPLRTWIQGLYIEATSPSGVSSLQLAKDLGIHQSNAWFMLHRIREGLMSLVAGNAMGGAEALQPLGDRHINEPNASTPAHGARGGMTKVCAAANPTQGQKAAGLAQNGNSSIHLKRNGHDWADESFGNTG